MEIPRPPPTIDDTNIKKVKLVNTGSFGLYTPEKDDLKDLEKFFDNDGTMKAKIRGGLRETRQALQSYQKRKKGIESSSPQKPEESVQKKTRKHRVVKPIGKPISSPVPPETQLNLNTTETSPGKGMKLKIQVGGNSGIRSLDGKDFSSRIHAKSKTHRNKRVRFRVENETMSISPIRDVQRKMRLQMVRGKKTHSNRGTHSYLNHSRRTMKLKLVPLNMNSKTSSNSSSGTEEPENVSQSETSPEIPTGLSLSDNAPESLRNDLLQLSRDIRNIRRVT
jgi:hypothetical protein